MSDIAPGDVTVVVPSIPQRASSRLVTLAQLDALGFDVLVVEQHPDLELGSVSSTVTAKRALELGLSLSDGGVLFIEDDVDVDPYLVQVLDILSSSTCISLWHRRGYVPRRYWDYSGEFDVVKATNLSRWFGTLGVWFPRHIAEVFVDIPHGENGTDLHLRNVLKELGEDLFVTLPSLVEHREGRRYASRNGNRVVSHDYRGPLSAR